MVKLWILGTLALSFVLTVAVEQLALRWGIVSRRSYRRKQHERTALMGGLAVFASSIAGLLYFSPQIGLPLVVSFIPLFILGVFDDIWEVGGRWKLTAQVLSAMTWVAFIPSDQLVVFQFIPHASIAIAITIAFLIGVTNAYNLIDGVDGQASLLGIISWIALSLAMPDPMVGWISMAAIGGFLIRNFPPAKIYLGEIGSTYIGFSLAAMATVLPLPEPSPVYLLAILFLFSLPLTDTVAAVYRRLLRGKSVFWGDREHIHHRLQKLQFPVVLTIMVMGIMGSAGALTFLIAFKAPTRELQAGVFVLSGLMLSLCFFGVLHLERHFSQRVLGLGRGLLEKHISTERRSLIGLVPSRAIVLDLLPYFRELQAHGILTLNDFLSELGDTVESLAEKGRIEFIGSYSVAIFFSHRDEWTKVEKSEVSAKFYELFHRYHCVRSAAEIPEGVTFCNLEQMASLLKLVDVKSQDVHEQRGAA